MDPIAWVQITHPTLSLYVYAVAEQIHKTRAEQQKQREGS